MRIMKLAIKKPKGVLWKTDLNSEDIQKMLQAGKITEEWLVCPQGEAGDAVLISEFLGNPSIFKSNSHEKKEESKTKPKRKDLNVLLPCWALAYFPIVFLAGALFGIGDPFGGYYVFIFSGAALLVLTPCAQPKGLAWSWQQSLSCRDVGLALVPLLPLALVWPAMALWLVAVACWLALTRAALLRLFNGINGDMVGATIEGGELWLLILMWSWWQFVTVSPPGI